jgi:hypothetical protein
MRVILPPDWDQDAHNAKFNRSNKRDLLIDGFKFCKNNDREHADVVNNPKVFNNLPDMALF